MSERDDERREREGGSGGATGGGDLQRLGDLLSAGGAGLDRGPAAELPVERRVMEVWDRVVGPDVASNASPASLRRGRLTIATSSSVWAQTLQLMGESLIERLNVALGEEAVIAVSCRPAGWDPGAGALGPRPLRTGWSDVPGGSDDSPGDAGPFGASKARRGRPPAGDQDPTPARAEGLPDLPLSDEEEAAIAELERSDIEPGLRAQIARVMRGFFVRAHQREAAERSAREHR